MLCKLVIALLATTAVSATLWHVDNNGTTCLIVKADPTLTVNFPSGDNYTLAINETQRFGGDCNATINNVSGYQRLDVDFTPSKEKLARFWRLSLTFKKNDNGFELYDYSVTTTNVPGMNGTVDTTFNKVGNASDISVRDNNNAYKCSSTPLGLSSNSTVDMKDFHVLAFTNQPKAEFPASQVYEMCKADAQTSDVVPIIVGACLAGLVVIVLVAYLIGRARARRQGYASV